MNRPIQSVHYVEVEAQLRVATATKATVACVQLQKPLLLQLQMQHDMIPISQICFPRNGKKEAAHASNQTITLVTVVIVGLLSYLPARNARSIFFLEKKRLSQGGEAPKLNFTMAL